MAAVRSHSVVSPLHDVAHPLLVQEFEVALRGLFRRGAPANTLRAMERDRAYVTAGKQAPMLAQARGKVWRAKARPRVPKSPRPLTREILETLFSTCDISFRDQRNRAILFPGWASGGQRRSEITALQREDIEAEAFAETGLIGPRLLHTKTPGQVAAPRLALKGWAARAVMDWIGAVCILVPVVRWPKG